MLSNRWLCGFVLVAFGGIAAAEEVPKPQRLLQNASDAYRAGKMKEALSEVSKVIEADPKNLVAVLLRARWYSDGRKLKEAVADYDRAIKLAPKNAAAFHGRGSARFMAGDIAGSIEDFDRQIELAPRTEAAHWQRGISYYYAGRFRDGQRQFETGQKTYASDVENVVWCYCCQAKIDGVEKARAAMLKLEGKDRRIPMMEVYDLYRGKATVEDVFKAANAGKPDKNELLHRLFYAHLYVALYYESLGERKKAREHVLQADKRAISHYMWDVAHVHAMRLGKEKKPAK